MSRTQIANHYSRILAQWPVDRLRPAQVQFQRLLDARIASASDSSSPSSPASPTSASSSTPPATSARSKDKKASPHVVAQRRTPSAADEMAEINALYSLLENRYTNAMPLSPTTMQPRSDPEHFSRLAAELEQIPNRSRFGNFLRRLQAMVRWK